MIHQLFIVNSFLLHSAGFLPVPSRSAEAFRHTMPHAAHTVSIDDIRVSALNVGHNPSSPQTHHITSTHYILYNTNSTRAVFLPEPPPDTDGAAAAGQGGEARDDRRSAREGARAGGRGRAARVGPTLCVSSLRSTVDSSRQPSMNLAPAQISGVKPAAASESTATCVACVCAFGRGEREGVRHRGRKGEEMGRGQGR